MTKKYNILVFPCGSEIGLEIYRSLRYSIHINLIGANSIDDHGKFVFENYIPDVPFYDDINFIPFLREIVESYNIDAIYPAMDSVLTKLSSAEVELNCKVIGSPTITNEICLSKSKTYNTFKNLISVPKIFSDLKGVIEYPVFMKPDIGYGSRGAKLINNYEQGIEHLSSFSSCIILENLPGTEYTVDCFTDKNGQVLFSKARIRQRISNGISVNTVPVKERIDKFDNIARLINKEINLRGAWFFQLKENQFGELSLLEIASRLGGSSSLFRNLGVNFALLTVFDAFNHNVNIFYNDFDIELDRALDNRYKVNISFNKVYVDFDDCLLLGSIVNSQLIALLYQFINEEKKLILITKHEKNIEETLKQYRLSDIFDEVIHLDKNHYKYEYIEPNDSIFIDDSFAERFQVFTKLKIPVFAPDNIECLLK